jgi:hypothetical protein
VSPSSSNTTMVWTPSNPALPKVVLLDFPDGKPAQIRIGAQEVGEVRLRWRLVRGAPVPRTANSNARNSISTFDVHEDFVDTLVKWMLSGETYLISLLRQLRQPFVFGSGKRSALVAFVAAEVDVKSVGVPAVFATCNTLNLLQYW